MGKPKVSKQEWDKKREGKEAQQIDIDTKTH